MHTLADIVVHLLAYASMAGIDPNTGQCLDYTRADDDEKNMEPVYAMLDSATEAEYAALRAAVARAIAKESACNWIAAYEGILNDLEERESARTTPSA